MREKYYVDGEMITTLTTNVDTTADANGVARALQLQFPGVPIGVGPERLSTVDNEVRDQIRSAMRKSLGCGPADGGGRPTPTPPPRDPSAPRAETDRWTRGVLQSAWQSVYPTAAATTSELQLLQAIGRLEGYYGLSQKPPQWHGSNNWAASLCDHGPPCGNDCFVVQSLDAGRVQVARCFRRFLNAVAGAEDLVRTLSTERIALRDGLAAGDTLMVAQRMYEANCYEGPPELYAAALYAHAELIANALGEPVFAKNPGAAPAPRPRMTRQQAV